jgi:hypothetical protein
LLDRRSKWKTQFHEIESSSKFHLTLKNIFTTDPFFKNLKCFQEVAVSSLVENYVNRFDAVDWYIDELNIIIELHGVQHYKMQSFGSKDSYANQVKAFNNIKFRDNRKKHALMSAGYLFLEISYKDIKKLSAEYLREQMQALYD